MSAILVAVAGPQAGEWIDALRAHAKGRELRAWPDAIGDPNDIADQLLSRQHPSPEDDTALLACRLPG